MIGGPMDGDRCTYQGEERIVIPKITSDALKDHCATAHPDDPLPFTEVKYYRGDLDVLGQTLYFYYHENLTLMAAFEKVFECYVGIQTE